MLSKTLGSFLALALVVPGLAQAPAAPTLSSDPQEIFSIVPRHFGPMRYAGERPSGGVESYNWSGYAVTGAAFTKATGSWKEPKINCKKSPNSYAAFWVGIDGYSSTTVEQTGTLAVCAGTKVSYYAWWEFYPTNDIQTISTITVSPGDVISAEVEYSGSEFVLKITDVTTKKSFTTKGTVSGAARSSAEWIAEAPANSSGILPLADFGTADFGDDYTKVKGSNDATDSTASGAISAFGTDAESITMINQSSGKDEAVPSNLSTDGTSFTVAWKSE
ncbi:MAG: G1 family glutamic endopeptidase [Candidatus Sulfotelmatobacter sp.]